jgi:DNA repair photolyase
MSRRTTFVTYQPKTILNKGKRADHWFWSRYSAYPYIGCQHGCIFCYCREEKYCPYDDPQDFAHVIKIKENAPQLLHKNLIRTPVDVVFTGDYQPAERKFCLSRKMLEVCLELGFPVFILERSPLVLRDLDLLQALEQRARAVVAFSIIYTPESPQALHIRQIEGLAPPPEKRFAAMQKIAQAGLLTGTVCMPILPGFCDDDANLEAIVRWTAAHGGKFVIASGLTLANQQKQHFLEYLHQRFPDRVDHYQILYPPGSYGPINWPWKQIALRLKALCQQYGITDRMPRPIIPGEKRALNKRVVEVLANRLYDLELSNPPPARVWAYRKAAWAIEDMEQDIGLVYRQLGIKGLQSIPGVGPRLGKDIEKLIIQ